MKLHKMTRRWMGELAALLAALLTGIAQAVPINADVTVTLTGDSDVSYEVASGVTLTISVSGATNTLSGVIKVGKLGATIILR